MPAAIRPDGLSQPLSAGITPVCNEAPRLSCPRPIARLPSPPPWHSLLASPPPSPLGAPKLYGPWRAEQSGTLPVGPARGVAEHPSHARYITAAGTPPDVGLPNPTLSTLSSTRQPRSLKPPLAQGRRLAPDGAPGKTAPGSGRVPRAHTASSVVLAQAPVDFPARRRTGRASFVSR